MCADPTSCISASAGQNTFELAKLAVQFLTTFLGAYFAFSLAGYRIRRDEQKYDLRAVNLTIVSLLDAFNYLETYKQDCIEPFKDRHDSWLNLPATPGKEWDLVSPNYEDLAFLLDGKDGNVLNKIMLFYSNAKECKKLIELRDEIIIKSVHPPLKGKLGTQLMSEEEITALIGSDVAHRLKFLTAGIVRRVPSQVDAAKRLHDELREAAVRIYPGKLPRKVIFGVTPAR